MCIELDQVKQELILSIVAQFLVLLTIVERCDYERLSIFSSYLYEMVNAKGCRSK